MNNGKNGAAIGNASHRMVNNLPKIVNIGEKERERNNSMCDQMNPI